MSLFTSGLVSLTWIGGGLAYLATGSGPLACACAALVAIAFTLGAVCSK